MSEIADAIHADAEAARAEIRAAGLICPSCGVNMADLPDDHDLALSCREPFTARCRNGKLAELAEFETVRAAANISLYDEFRKRENEAWDRILGTR